MKEFPGLVELNNKYKDKVACISLSFDFYGGAVKEFEPKVLKFLREQNAAFDNVLCSTPVDDVYDKFIEHKLPGGTDIPIVLVFSKDGKLARRFDNPGFTYEKDVEPFVATLVKE